MLKANSWLQRLCWLIFLLVSTSSFPQNASSNVSQNADTKPVLRVAFPNTPPWSYTENNRTTGLDCDILQGIALEMGVTLDIILVPHRRRLALMTTGNADIIVTTLMPETKTAYQQILLIDQQPLYQYLIGASTLKGRSVQITSLADLYHYRVGHLRVPVELEDALLPEHPNRMRFNTDLSMLKGLLTGRVDIVFAPPVELWYPAKKLGVENRLQLVYKYSYLPLVTAWSAKGLGARRPEIRQQFNLITEKLRRDGKIASILQSYGKLEHFKDYGAEPPSDAHNE